MQLLRLRSAIRRHHPPQRAVLSQICCFGEHKVALFQILLDGAEPHDAGTTWLSSPVCWRGTNRILLAYALSSMHIICPNRVSWHDWIIAVSLGCFVSLRTSSFWTNWYHLMPSSIRRHHWSSTPILCASVSVGLLLLCLWVIVFNDVAYLVVNEQLAWILTIFTIFLWLCCRNN